MAVLKNVAVFTPGEIQDYDPSKTKFSSRGALERALEDGFTIYVVSNRDALTHQDNWWRALIPPERVFHIDQQAELNSGLNLNAPWKKLYEALRLTYPRQINAGKDCGDASWTAARLALTQHGCRLGSSFGRTYIRSQPMRVGRAV